jgi:Pectate lyase superfamily protein
MAGRHFENSLAEMRRTAVCFAVLILLCTKVINAQATLPAAPTLIAPPYEPSSVFSLTANGKTIPVTHFSNQYDYATFDAEVGPCELKISRLDGKPIETYSISPLNREIAGQILHGILLFSVPKPEYLIIDVDKLKRLVIAIDPPETDMPASSGPGICNVTDGEYGADRTGQRSSTAAIQKAIDHAAIDPAHHGVVYVPDGVYLSSNLQLKSNVSFYLQTGAVLRCSGTRDEFATQFEKKSRRLPGTWFISTAGGSSNVRIFGRGTIDGNGKAMARDLHLLVHLVVPMDCSHFTMDGPVLRDSGLWGTVVARSNHVIIQNTKHFNFLDMGEDDGIDICESQDVLLQHVLVISLDDSFSFKSWTKDTDVAKYWTGNPQPLRGVVLDDCFAWSRCFAFKVGAGVNQPESDITVRNSVVYDAAHGIGISHSYGSADVRNILFDTIDIERCTTDCLGRSWARFVIDKRKNGETGGNVFDVRLHNIKVRDAGTMPVPIEGLSDQSMIHGITFDRIYMPGQTIPTATLEQLGVNKTTFADGISVRN